MTQLCHLREIPEMADYPPLVCKSLRWQKPAISGKSLRWQVSVISGILGARGVICHLRDLIFFIFLNAFYDFL